MDIIYKDEHILVINKPAGLSVLPEGWEPDAPYLVKSLEEEYEKIWVVHRLDKFTSGVLVFALNAEAHRALNIQFEKHETEKVYRAITVGAPPWKERITKFPLRVNVGHKHRTMVDNKKGVRAETKFKVLNWNSSITDELFLADDAEGMALVEARPMTGRTHQIRVHAYALGYPLLGDTLYSSPETDIIARPALHAYSLSFNHPVSNERVSFTAPYPTDFKKALERLKL
ncbi:MAG TPA: RluA family pseudouridine synthase [Anaerolineales bacterium]|nr:RluA family pseudouridine synthase [Anaerolineales bacterium]